MIDSTARRYKPRLSDSGQKHVPNSYDVSNRETGIDLLILNNHKNVCKIDVEVWSHM